MARTLTGLPRDREAATQDRLLRVLERQYTGAIAAEIDRASRAMIATFEQSRTAPSLPIEHEQRMAAIYADMAEASIRTFGARIVEQGKAYSPELELKDLSGFAAFFQRISREWVGLEAIRRRITSVAETTRAQIVNGITAGQEAGLGTSEVARGIIDRVPGISRRRAGVIARTETHGAANFGADQTARATGLQLEKEWVSTHDMRTRAFAKEDPDVYDHRSMDGQTVDMDQPFLMPYAFGEPLRIAYPGEAGAPAAAVINCRCTSIHKVKGLL